MGFTYTNNQLTFVISHKPESIEPNGQFQNCNDFK
jgi:hypothetical protein